MLSVEENLFHVLYFLKSQNLSLVKQNNANRVHYYLPRANIFNKVHPRIFIIIMMIFD